MAPCPQVKVSGVMVSEEPSDVGVGNWAAVEMVGEASSMEGAKGNFDLAKMG
jgi:hypothetical protein